MNWKPKNNFIPCCYYPTTVAIIDDNSNFLNSFKLELLNTANIATQLFDNPQTALKFFTQEYQPHFFLERCITHLEEEQSDHRIIDFDLKEIYQEIYNPSRFDQISVIIVDYAMPGLDGLSLCRSITHKNIKKIMLTGEADEQIAIKAFNEGIIHKFVRKDDPDFTHSINVAVQEFQSHFFQELSEMIVTVLTKDPTRPPALLDDPVFIDFFSNLVRDLNVAEFYLTDSFGSFMFLTEEGEMSWLTIKNAEEMLAWSEIARYASAPKAIYEPIKMGKKILYLLTKSDLKINPSTWSPYLHPADKFEGRETYFYAVITDPTSYPLEKDVISYKQHLHQHL